MAYRQRAFIVTGGKPLGYRVMRTNDDALEVAAEFTEALSARYTMYEAARRLAKMLNEYADAVLAKRAKS